MATFNIQVGLHVANAVPANRALLLNFCSQGLEVHASVPACVQNGSWFACGTNLEDSAGSWRA